MVNAIPMILHCPECSERHIDVGEFATKGHHTHACQGCGLTWRPAIVATVGVQFLNGSGQAGTCDLNCLKCAAEVELYGKEST